MNWNGTKSTVYRRHLLPLFSQSKEKSISIRSSTKMTNKVKILVSESQTNNRQLSWGLQPIKTWMGIIAVLPAFSITSDNYYYSRIYLICHFGVWLFTTTVHSLMLFVFFHLDHNTFFATLGQVVYDKATFAWIRLINYTNSAIHCFGIHSALVFILTKEWKQLQESIEQSEARFAMPKKYIYKYRKLCVAGIAYIILTVRFLVNT